MLEKVNIFTCVFVLVVRAFCIYFHVSSLCNVPGKKGFLFIQLEASSRNTDPKF